MTIDTRHAWALFWLLCIAWDTHRVIGGWREKASSLRIGFDFAFLVLAITWYVKTVGRLP